jgi:hypothetical protein
LFVNQPACGDGFCDGGGASHTPDPLPPPPDNLGQCSAGGGVAWQNGSSSGCLGNGDGIPFCGGSLWGLGGGRGRFILPGGNDSWDVTWGSENDAGCSFGG